MTHYSVKQLAKLADISVRTLHYYDEIDLLKPTKILSNGYRQYGQKELLKLQQILFFKELEFPLSQIKDMLNDSQFNVGLALKEQKQLLKLKKQRLENLILTIDQTSKKLKEGQKNMDSSLYNGFSKSQIEAYKKEAKDRWGHTSAYKQSVKHTKNWTQKDYDQVKAQGEALTRQIANGMGKGANDPSIQALIAKHHQYIGQFYDCPLSLYKALGQMYVEDKRFTAYYEKFKPGLATFMRDAINVYCLNRTNKH